MSGVDASEEGIIWEGLTPEDFIEELQESTALTRREAKKVMREGAKEIMEASRQMCPVDLHNLEEAHHIEEIRSSRDNLELEIDVGGFVGGRNVDDYAMVMHESTYKLGPGSQAKDASNPPDRPVGPQFLSRAVDLFEEKLVEAISQTLVPEK
jgi:hypothetical protein